MVRRTPPLLLAAAAASLAVPAAAHADVIGASAKYHGGFMKTDRDETWLQGGEVALQLFGFELFADLRLLEGHFDKKNVTSDWFWDRIGLRFDVGLPFSFGADHADVFVDASYVATRRPDPAVLASEDDREKAQIGGMVGAGLRFDYKLFWKFFFTVQPEAGIQFLTINVDEPKPGVHASVLGAIKLDI